MRIVRRLRILEYVGTEDFVNECIERRYVKGRWSTQDGSISEVLLGETNELLSESEVTARQEDELAK